MITELAELFKLRCVYNTVDQEEKKPRQSRVTTPERACRALLSHTTAPREGAAKKPKRDDPFWRDQVAFTRAEGRREEGAKATNAYYIIRERFVYTRINKTAVTLSRVRARAHMSREAPNGVYIAVV